MIDPYIHICFVFHGLNVYLSISVIFPLLVHYMVRYCPRTMPCCTLAIFCCFFCQQRFFIAMKQVYYNYFLTSIFWPTGRPKSPHPLRWAAMAAVAEAVAGAPPAPAPAKFIISWRRTAERTSKNASNY